MEKIIYITYIWGWLSLHWIIWLVYNISKNTTVELMAKEDKVSSHGLMDMGCVYGLYQESHVQKWAQRVNQVKEDMSYLTVTVSAKAAQV